MPKGGGSPSRIEALLLIVFAVLTNTSAATPDEERDAFDSLTRELRRFVALLLAAWRIPDPWLAAEDVVQQVFVRFLTRRLAERFDRTRSDRRAAFLYGVVRIIVHEYVRRRLAEDRTTTTATASLPGDVADPAPGPAEAAALAEVSHEVNAAVERLRPTLATAIRDQFWAPDASVGALTPSVRNGRTFRARQALREALGGLCS